MKRLLVLPFVCAACIATAQMTLTAGDLPQVGENWGLYFDDDGGSAFVPTPPGPAQSWDWTNAFEVSGTTGISWSAPTGLSGAGLFPGADLALDNSDNETFFGTDATGFYQMGSYFVVAGFTATEHTSGGLILPVPFTMGSNRAYENVSTSITVFDGDPAMKIVSRGGGVFTCDAWGTMHTPAYPSGVAVVRVVKTGGETVDSTFIDLSGTGSGPWTFSDTETDAGDTYYMFVRNGHPAIVADVSSGGVGATYYSSELPNGIPAQGMAMVSPQAYPVPSNNGMVHIRPLTTSGAQLEVVNTMGEILRHIDIHGVDLVNLSTEGFASGAYLYRCLDDRGVVLGQGRFIVQR